MLRSAATSSRRLALRAVPLASHILHKVSFSTANPREIYESFKRFTPSRPIEFDPAGRFNLYSCDLTSTPHLASIGFFSFLASTSVAYCFIAAPKIGFLHVAYALPLALLFAGRAAFFGKKCLNFLHKINLLDNGTNVELVLYSPSRKTYRSTIIPIRALATHYERFQGYRSEFLLEPLAGAEIKIGQEDVQLQLPDASHPSHNFAEREILKHVLQGTIIDTSFSNFSLGQEAKEADITEGSRAFMASLLETVEDSSERAELVDTYQEKLQDVEREVAEERKRREKEQEELDKLESERQKRPIS